VQESHTGKCVQFVSNEPDGGISIFFREKTQGKWSKNGNKKVSRIVKKEK
jgi:hypothetical protein